MSDMADAGAASHESSTSSGSFDSGSGSSSASQAAPESPKPGSAASIRPIPGQPPRSASQLAQANGEATDQQQTNGNGQKPESRYERTKRERKEWKERADAREAAIAQREQAFAEERAKFEESKKPKRNYTLDELKKYRGEWAQEAQSAIDPDIVSHRQELVRRADIEIANMENEARASRNTFDLPRLGTEEHTRIWNESEAQIRKEDPEFGVPGTRIDQKLHELFKGPNGKLYLDHAYGIYAAYAEAQKEILKEDNTALKQKVQNLEQELQRVTGLTSISGGVPGRISGEQKDFAKLTSAEMRKRLMAGRSRPDHSMPWL